MIDRMKLEFAFPEDTECIDPRHFSGWMPSEIEEVIAPVRQKNHTKSREPIDTLVLWDIENVHFSRDRSVIHRWLRSLGIEHSWRHIAARDRHKTPFWASGFDPQRRISLLQRHGWVIDHTHRDADNALIVRFEQNRNRLKRLVVISVDGDFATIAREAREQGIEVWIAGNHPRPHWVASVEGATYHRFEGYKRSHAK